MFRRTLLATSLIVLLWLPNPSHAQSQSDTERALLLALIESLQQQIALLQAELERREFGATSSVTDIDEGESEPAIYQNLPRGLSIKAQYADVDPEFVTGMRNLRHRLYLERIFELFPDRYDDELQEFLVFEDQRARFDGYVTTIPPKHRTWAFAVNEEVLRDVGDEASDELIVHELAHLISYDEIPNGTARDCPAYFVNRGCPRAESYLLAFTHAFWDDADLRRAERYARNADGVDAAQEYYEENESAYLSDYAALSPEEDFAESFALYVVDPIPRGGSERSRKVWWFDQFSELRTIKEHVNDRR